MVIDLRSRQFNLDNADTIELETFMGQKMIEIQAINEKMFDTMVSVQTASGDVNEFDETRKPAAVYIDNNNSKLQANSVYQSKHMQLSRFISSNKSKGDQKSYYN